MSQWLAARAGAAAPSELKHANCALRGERGANWIKCPHAVSCERDEREPGAELPKTNKCPAEAGLALRQPHFASRWFYPAQYDFCDGLWNIINKDGLADDLTGPAVRLARHQ